MITSVPTEASNRERGEVSPPEDTSWLEATSVEDVLSRWPERVDSLLEAVNLEYPGLEKVREAVEADDRAAACHALLDYYSRRGRKDWVVSRLGVPRPAHVEGADLVLDDRHRAQGNVTGRVPEEHEAWDWNYTGPKGDREFAFNLNRHQTFIHLYQAWKRTGEADYAEAFDRLVRDWVLHVDYPGLDPADGRGPGKCASTWTWRVLEAGMRMRSWTVAFHAFLESEQFTPAARLLMLSSLAEHGEYIKHHHWRGHNHALMEHDGLNRLGLAFPEFKEAENWHRYAFNEMLGEMDRQVYPDGAHDELSSGYHWVSLSSFENLADVTMDAGGEVPPDYMARLIDMYDYWAGLVRPDGSLPQNNRADRSMVADRLLAAAERYERPDWRYIVTNGTDGDPPEGQPSRFAPWAGHLVSRSAWDKDALWSFFDAGPAGAGAVDADALHLSVTAFGKDFLIDSGRFWYMDGKWKTFARSSRAHNVILIDGKEQKTQPKKVEHPLDEAHWAVTDDYDFARKRHEHFRDLSGEAAHTRTLVFLKDLGCWVVLDRIATDRPRELTPMWRFRPEREVKIDTAGNLITADSEGANLAITPLGPVSWSVELIRGQEDPYVQGWYSEETPNWTPNTVAEFTGEINDETVFAWVIVPTREEPATPAQNAALEVVDGCARVTFQTYADKQPLQIDIPLEQGHPRLIRPTESGR